MNLLGKVAKTCAAPWLDADKTSINSQNMRFATFLKFPSSSKLIVALSSEQKDRIPTGLMSKFHVSESFIQCQGILNLFY